VAATPSRVAVPWAKLKEMWDSGRSYQEMAKATDAHFNPNSADPTKPTRAKISMALNKGVRIDGELVQFKPRIGMKALGIGKMAPKLKEE